jgi:hypothetical protein
MASTFLCRRVCHLDKTCDYCPRRATHVFFGLRDDIDTEEIVLRLELCARCMESFHDKNRHAINLERMWPHRCELRGHAA